jgi:hypothetical protein
LRENCRESQQASQCGILTGLSTASLQDHGSTTSDLTPVLVPRISS